MVSQPLHRAGGTIRVSRSSCAGAPKRIKSTLGNLQQSESVRASDPGVHAHVNLERDLNSCERFPSTPLREQAQTRAVDELTLLDSFERQDRG